MNNDRPKYVPDVAKVLRDNEPAAFDERERQALTKLRQEGLIDRLTPEPASRVSAPSPWGKKGASAEIDAAALPSAMMPAADVQPVTKPVAARGEKRRWPGTWIVVGGAIAFMLAVGLVAVV
jgi:hypothetical protein